LVGVGGTRKIMNRKSLLLKGSSEGLVKKVNSANRLKIIIRKGYFSQTSGKGERKWHARKLFPQTGRGNM